MCGRSRRRRSSSSSSSSTSSSSRHSSSSSSSSNRRFKPNDSLGFEHACIFVVGAAQYVGVVAEVVVVVGGGCRVIGTSGG